MILDSLILILKCEMWFLIILLEWTRPPQQPSIRIICWPVTNPSHFLSTVDPMLGYQLQDLTQGRWESPFWFSFVCYLIQVWSALLLDPLIWFWSFEVCNIWSIWSFWLLIGLGLLDLNSLVPCKNYLYNFVKIIQKM